MISKKKCSLSPAGGGRGSIERKFQMGVDKLNRIVAAQECDATEDEQNY
jgi:hypothetical protein